MNPRLSLLDPPSRFPSLLVLFTRYRAVSLVSCTLLRTVRTRSSSVIDRNLSLTSLPPGAKILPGAHHGPDLWLPCILLFVLMVNGVSLLLVGPRKAPTCVPGDNRSSGIAAGAPTRASSFSAIFIYRIDQHPGRDLYLWPSAGDLPLIRLLGQVRDRKFSSDWKIFLEVLQSWHPCMLVAPWGSRLED